MSNIFDIWGYDSNPDIWIIWQKTYWCNQWSNKPQGKKLWVRWSWPISINILQMDYCSGYVTKFWPIPMIQKVNEAFVLTWTLFLLLSRCTYLWHFVDTKETPLKCNWWELWVLTTTQHVLFKLDSIQVNRRLPLKKLATFNAIVSKVNCVHGGQRKKVPLILRIGWFVTMALNAERAFKCNHIYHHTLDQYNVINYISRNKDICLSRHFLFCPILVNATTALLASPLRYKYSSHKNFIEAVSPRISRYLLFSYSIKAVALLIFRKDSGYT